MGYYPVEKITQRHGARCRRWVSTGDFRTEIFFFGGESDEFDCEFYMGLYGFI